jgi:hypothetical protein
VSFAQKTIGNDSRKTNMGKVATGLSMSLDGFIAGPNDGPIAVVSAVDPLLQASASSVNRLRDGVRRGIVRASAQRWVNTTAHRYRSPLGDDGTVPTGKRPQSSPGIPTLWGKPACIHEGKLTR